MNIKNSAATGSWWRINKQSDSPKEEVSLDVFKIWLDHGNRPSGESYEYIVVPATTIDEMEREVSKKNVRILSNTPEVQGVENTKLGICQAVFYKAGELDISDSFKLVTDNPGMVMLKMDGDRVTKISVSDPNREQVDFHLAISQKVLNPGQYLDAVWNEKEQMTHITIRLPQKNYSGASVTIKL